MARNEAFEEAKQKHLQTLKQYVPIVDKVHGGHHPEFHEVRALFQVIVDQSNEPDSHHPEWKEAFAKLREITGNYTVPDDVCESYEAVYRMLAELDHAYHA